MNENDKFKYPALDVKRKRGDEPFTHNGSELDCQLSDFWKWAVSDLVCNTTRGILAEFIVASAFGEVVGVRKEWDAYDLRLPDDTKIEVKSTAYCQSWAQNDHSRPEFTIKPTYGWESETNTTSDESRRQADIYVFCLYYEKEKSNSIDPMNLDKWSFYVVPARQLNESFKSQKKIGLKSLASLSPEPEAVSYGDLKTEVIRVAKELKTRN